MSKRLLDLMLEHDVRWPDGAACAAQGKDGEIIFTKSDAKHVSRGHFGWTDDMGGWMDLAGIKAAIATDQATAVITRGAYEAAKAKKTPAEQILHDRGTTYGSFNDNARVSQEIKTSIASGAGYGALSDRHKEALEFIAGKIARIVNGGNPDYADNWDDISGYALLGKEDEKCTP